MCCLTIYKHKGNVIFTHNRDENNNRPSVNLKIECVNVGGSLVFMPMDAISKGTWIASDGKRMAAILNGFGENHVKKSSYKASRGSIIPAYFEYEDMNTFVELFDPNGMEPFTLVAYEYGKMAIYGWDERVKYFEWLDTEIPQIFSSVTLYNEQVQKGRRLTFEKFLELPRNEEDIWAWHRKEGEDHCEFVNVEVSEQIRTTATSQIVLGENRASFTYMEKGEFQLIEMG